MVLTMDRQPTWLRREWSYRAYVRGLRYGLVSALGAGIFILLGASRVIGLWVPTIGVFAAFALAIPAVAMGIVGWINVPDKNRANLHQLALLKMVAHDMFRGLPPNNG